MREIQIVLNGEETCGNVSILDQPYLKNKWVPEHMHTKEGHLVEVKKGVFLFRIEGLEYLRKEGETILIQKNVWHSFVGLENDNLLRIILFPAGLEKLIQVLAENKVSERKANSLYAEFGIIFK